MNELGNLKRLQEVAAAIERKELRVGYFENAVYPDGTPVSGVAATMEFGSKKEFIPPRPTLEPGVRLARQEMSEAVKYAAKQAISGSLDTDRVLEAAGVIAQASVRKEIRNTTEPPLSVRTIAGRATRHGKGIASTKPLVDTGQMLNSVAFAIVDAEDSDEQPT